MSDIKADDCIVGAGPSGLTLALQLLRAGKTVLIVERDARVGGLAKSYDYAGHVFDTGPKRFHTDDPIVLNFIHEVMKDGLSTIGRSTKVFFLDNYFDWPLRASNLFQLPLSMSLHCLRDLLAMAFGNATPPEKDSFSAYIKSRYGKTLYDLFFEPYTSKFLRWDPNDIHSDWAATGINRTVIDRRIRVGALFQLLKSVSLPEKIDTMFLYPKEKGFGSFFDCLFHQCQEFPGFSILLGTEISKLTKTDTQLTAALPNGNVIGCKDLVWTGNLNSLLNLVTREALTVSYLNTVFYNLICKEQGINKSAKSQWVYVSRGDSLISRVTCMREFTPSNCPEGYYNLIIEVTDSAQKPHYFINPAQYKDAILAELLQMSFLKSNHFVEQIKINAIRDTYPIYHRRYRSEFGAAVKAIRQFSPSIHLLGRSGAFWYNNSDHSIRMAIDFAKFLLKQADKPLDYRSYFGSGVDKADVKKAA